MNPPSRPLRDDVRADATRAVAIVYGRGAGMSLLALVALMLDEGIPPRAERERMLEERLAEAEAGGDTTTFSSPGLLGRGDAPNAPA